MSRFQTEFSGIPPEVLDQVDAEIAAELAIQGIKYQINPDGSVAKTPLGTGSKVADQNLPQGDKA